MKTTYFLLKAVVLIAAFSFSAGIASAYYDPGMQRWLNRDPLKQIKIRLPSTIRYRAFRHYDEPNLFLFVLNSPINYRDPVGLDPVTSMCELKQCAEKIAHEVGSDYCGANALKQNHDLDPDCRVAHCIATCRMARECPGGGATAIAAGWWREMTHWSPDSPGDLFANREGFRISRGNESCEKACVDLTEELGGM